MPPHPPASSRKASVARSDSAAEPLAFPVSPSLTARQAQILALIRRNIDRTGLPPTRAEIATECDFRSVNAAEEHLRALERKGLITILQGTARGLRLTASGRAQGDRSGLSSGRVAQAVTGHLAGTVVQAVTEHLAGLLPLLGRVAAGAPILAVEHVVGHYAVDPQLFRPAADYLLTVRGLSMRDAGIIEGDLLAVHQTAEARSGQIIVARIADEVTVKRLQRYENHIELLPANPDFEPIIVRPGEDGFAIEGLVVGLIRDGLAGAP